MAWTTPMTFTAGSVLTAAQLNTHLRDNVKETAPAKATAAGRLIVTTGANAVTERVISSDYKSASENTGSTSYGALTTPGPEIAGITTGTRALVWISAELTNNTTGGIAYMGVDVSGATTISASDDQALYYQAYGSNARHRGSVLVSHTALTAGNNTFTAKYKVSSGTGGWQYRRMTVMAL